MSDAAAAAPAKAAALPPGDFVRGVVGRPVVVRLSTGSDYRGILVCLDGFMNIALEQAEEYTDGVLVSKLGDCFLRGNNGEGNGGLSWWRLHFSRCDSSPRSCDARLTPSPHTHILPIMNSSLHCESKGTGVKPARGASSFVELLLHDTT